MKVTLNTLHGTGVGVGDRRVETFADDTSLVMDFLVDCIQAEPQLDSAPN